MLTGTKASNQAHLHKEKAELKQQRASPDARVLFII